MIFSNDEWTVCFFVFCPSDSQASGYRNPRSECTMCFPSLIKDFEIFRQEIEHDHSI
jgi:galactose-1-phosphate uridylyltransferase